MTFRGNDFGGPRSNRGREPGTPQTAGGGDSWSRMRVRGRGPDSAPDYARDYRGGFPRDRERFNADRMVGDRSRGTGWTVRAGRYDRGFHGYGRDFDDHRPPLSAGFDRLQRLERDPRWRGDSRRIRQQLETGPGHTRWPSYHHDRGILRNSDGRF